MSQNTIEKKKKVAKEAIVVPEKIELIGIKVLNGNIDCPPNFSDKKVRGFNTNFDFKQSVNPKNKIVRVLFTADFTAIDASKRNLSLKAKYTIEFLFHVKNLNDFIISKDDKKKTINIDIALGTTLANIVYSTSRGIIFMRTQGTTLNNGIILSVIDPKTLLQD